MNSALNCEGHFLNLRCSVDPSPVGGGPFLTSQVTGSAEGHGGGWAFQAATYQFPDSLRDIGFLSHRRFIKYSSAEMSF